MDRLHDLLWCLQNDPEHQIEAVDPHLAVVHTLEYLAGDRDTIPELRRDA